MVLLISLATWGQQIKYESRNMPANCTYVYQVQTEVRISLENLPEKNSDWKIISSLKDAYSPGDVYTNPQTEEFQDQDGEAIVAWGFESMSTARSFLHREMRFEIVHQDTNRVLGKWLVSFGREFGEQCYNNSASTPFRTRKLLSL